MKKIKLRSYEIEEIVAKKFDNKEELEDLTDEANEFIHLGISEDNKKGIIIMGVEVVNEDKGQFIKIVLSTIYEILDDISKEEAIENLENEGIIRTSAYISSIVSTISALDSSDAVILT